MPRSLLVVSLALAALALIFLRPRAAEPLDAAPAKAPLRPPEHHSTLPELEPRRVEQPAPRHSWVIELRAADSDQVLEQAYGFVLRCDEPAPPIELHGGRHRLQLAAGWYQLAAGAPGRQPILCELSLDGDRVQVLSLPRPARLEVRVVHHGDPVPCEGRLLLARLDDPQIQQDLRQRSFRAEGAAMAAQIPVSPGMRLPSGEQSPALDRDALRAFFQQQLSWDRYWFGDGRRLVPVRRGRAQLGALPVGHELRLLLWPTAGFTDAVARTGPLRPGPQVLALEVAPAHLLHGRVRWRGREVPGARVHLWGRAEPPADAESAAPGEAQGTCAECADPNSDVDDVSVLTDEQGRFTARVDRRRVRVLVLHEPPGEPGLGLAHYQEVRFGEGAMQALDISLRDTPQRDGVIDQLITRVVDQRGRALAGAWVSLGVLGPQARSDANGEVRLFGLGGLAAHHREELDPAQARLKSELLCVDWQGAQGRHGSLSVPLSHARLDELGGRLPPLTLKIEEDAP